MATTTQPTVTTAVQGSTRTRSRLESLDVFRGLTIAGMILVNNPGDERALYWPLGHADELSTAHPSGWYAGKWWVDANGWTPTDLIFPFFLFIVGAAMILSFRARRARGDSRARLMKHVLRRSLLILLIGYAIRILPYVDFSRMRYPGVLQRIALVYLCASLLGLWTSTRARILWIAGLLVGYYGLMRLVHVPGCDVSAWATQHCSLAGWLDRTLMSGHLYRRDFDPEGLLSTLPAIATALLGTLCAEFLASAGDRAAKLRGLILAGVAGVVGGYLWHPLFPISKPLWSSSYVVFTAGAACLTLALCWWLVEMRRWTGWSKPFLWLGSNAILAYALSTFVGKLGAIIELHEADKAVAVQSWIYRHCFAPLAAPANASLLFALAYLLLWTVASWGLYRKRIFVKV